MPERERNRAFIEGHLDTDTPDEMLEKRYGTTKEIQHILDITKKNIDILMTRLQNLQTI